MASESWRDSSHATSKITLTQLLNLVKANKNDIFCDLGCAKGDLCIHALKKVGYCVGIDNYKYRHRVAKNKIRRLGLKDKVRVLKASYTSVRTLKRLTTCTIFYCTNELDIDFFKNFDEIMNTRFTLGYLHSSPIPNKTNKTTWMDLRT